MTPATPAPADLEPSHRPVEPPPWSDDGRVRSFYAWLASIAPRHALRPESLRLASADASSRRYFRIDGASPCGSFIVMDSPASEDSAAAFVRVAGLIQDAGLHGPRVLECDTERGFMLLDD